MKNIVPIVIPSYEPDERLIDLLKELKKEKMGPIIIVNDGSSDDYDSYFIEAKKLINGAILTHEVNKGKGRALKTAFSYILENYSDAIGCVTIDSDGQHSVNCTKNIINGLIENPNSLVLGVRNFDLDNVPWKSRMGNKITSVVFKFIAGVKVSDTQTGLRGIPSKFMKELLDVEGERFEFETKMLLETLNRYPIKEIEIETIYDSKENHQSHFNPFKDSIKIYKILGKKFLAYIASSLSSTVLDLVLFSFFSGLLKPSFENTYILLSTAIARVFSCTFNFIINYTKVFKSNGSVYKSFIKYALLAVVQMLASAGLVTLFVKTLSVNLEEIVKIIVDTVLFFISYKIQQNIIF